MKKLLTFIVGSALGLGAYAQDFDSGNLYYEVLSPDDKTCSVTGYSYLGSELEIPATVDYEGTEYTVTEIGSNAFPWVGVENLTLPSTLEVIGSSAFWNCNGLREVVIPNSVKEIGSDCFGACYGLNRVQLGTSVETIYSGAFRDCPISMVIALGDTPAQFVTDYKEVFTSKPEVAVPEDAMAAYKSAWEGANIVPYILAESIAFDQEYYEVQPGGTVQLKCVVYPENAPVKYTSDDPNFLSVDENGLAFAELVEGWRIKVTATAMNGLTATCYVDFGGMQRFSTEEFEFAFIPDTENEVAITRYDTEAGSKLVVPSTVEYDGNNYTVTRIAPYVGSHTSDIEEVVIPASVQQIGTYSFIYSRSLKKLTIEDATTPVNISWAITDNEDLSEIYIGRSWTSSYDYPCFRWSNKLSHIVLGPEVTSVPTNAFSQCNELNLLESQNPVPPVLGDDVFGWRSLSIIVPAASMEAYQSAWEQYASYISAAVEAESISFEDEEVTIYNGQRIKMPLTIEPADAQVLWTSSNPDLVSVDAEGYIEYGYWNREFGEVTIAATSLNGLSAECTVTAKPWLTLSENELNMTPGSTAKVEVTKAEELADAEIEWRSDNENVATVDENGNITAVSYGETNIQAEVYLPSLYTWISYSVRVVVRNVPTSVSVEYPEVTVFKDYDSYFNVVIEPQDDENLNREMTWTVADPEIAEIELDWNTTYRVRGLEAGKTTATGTTVNGLTTEVELTVLPRIEDFTFATNATYMTEGQTRQLEFTTEPVETYQTYTYTSSDEDIVTIDENGVMTAHGLGRAYVYVEYKTPWGSNSRGHEVNVVVAPENVGFVEGKSDFEGSINQWSYIGIEFTPNDADVCKHIDWTVEDPEIASVYNYDSNYNDFIGRKFGTTKFRGVAVNGQVLEGTITIAGLNVLVDGNNIWSREMSVGDEFKFDIEASSAQLLANVTVESSNPEAVTVAADGTVTAVGYGRAYINVSSWEDTANGRKDYSYSFEIVVRPEEGFVFTTSKVVMTPWYAGEYLSILTAPDLSTWDLDLTWETSDDNVAYVGWYGQDYAYVYYAGPGQATITATDLNGNGSATCDVTCYGIEMAEYNVQMDPNSTYQLQVNIIPDAEGVELEWESWNTEVVTVDENGLLTSYGEPGYATIMVRGTVNGREMYAYCNVEVFNYTLELSQTFVEMDPYRTYQLQAEVNPYVYGVDIEWGSYDDDIVSVDENGILTSYGVAGSTTVYAYASINGRDIYAYCNVEVRPLVLVSEILIDNPIINAAPDDEVQLYWTVYPADANEPLQWRSDDESVATVDENGLVHIHSAGLAGIYVTAPFSGVNAMAVVSGGASGVEGLLEKGECDIYDMNGIIVKKSATVDDYNKLVPGIYLIRKGDAVIKIKR